MTSSPRRQCVPGTMNKREGAEPLMADKRCKEKHPVRGTQCGLPAGHFGSHQNGTLCSPWSTEDKLVTGLDCAVRQALDHVARRELLDRL